MQWELIEILMPTFSFDSIRLRFIFKPNRLLLHHSPRTPNPTGTSTIATKTWKVSKHPYATKATVNAACLTR